MGGIAFTWNRSHTIGFVSLVVWGLIMMWVVANNVLSDPSTLSSFPMWLIGGLSYGAVGLAVANLVVGLMRTGSFAFPTASTTLYAVALLGFEIWRGIIGDGFGEVMANAVLTIVWFALTAVLPYAIGHYGIRRIMLPRLETGGRNRLERWALANPLVSGGALSAILIYALMIFVLSVDQYGFLTGISLMIFVPLGMAVVSGVAAAASPRAAVVLDLVALTVHALLFCSMAFINTTCFVGEICAALPGGLVFGWLESDWETIMTYAVPIVGAMVVGGLIGGLVGMVSRRQNAVH